MADTHGHDDSHAAEETDAVRTPMWLPFLGLALLLLGAISSYLWVYPGTMNPTTDIGDAATNGDASAEGGAVGQVMPQIVRPAQ